MAGSSFLRERSPVTPNSTRMLGPATRGSRLSRGSRNGLTNTELSLIAGGVMPVVLPCACADERTGGPPPVVQTHDLPGQHQVYALRRRVGSVSPTSPSQQTLT